MKAILEFSLPEEKYEHWDALQGSQWKWAWSELIEFLRSEIKHVDHTAEEYRMLDEIREKASEILEERDLSLYD